MNSIAKFCSTSCTIVRARSFHSASAAYLKVGEKLPSVNLEGESPAEKVNIADFSKGKKVIIFGVPGAFTPGCSKTHLPGYLKDYENIKAKGVDDIVCVSVNDAFVQTAWGQANNVGDKVKMLADTNAQFSKAIGTDFEVGVLGGIRSKRFAMIVNDGTVESFDVEPDNTGLSCSLSNEILKKL